MLVAGGLERGAATEATILADARVSLDALIAGLTALVDYEIPQVWLATRAACCFQTRYHRLKLHDFSELVSSPARLAITVEGGMVGVFVLEPDFSKGDQADIAIRPVEADSRHRAQEDLDAASLRAEIAKRREARPEIGEVVIAVASGSGLEVGVLATILGVLHEDCDPEGASPCWVEAVTLGRD